MKIARTAEERLTVESMGAYLKDYKNGEVWEFNGEEWYLSHLEMTPDELHEYLDAISII